MTYKQIVEKYKDCKLCEGCQNHTKVFGSGHKSAQVAIVGEGPGKDEVAQLTPFVGAAGQLLDKILSAIQLNREDLYFTNAILCRTDDKNRTPTQKEYTNCRQRLFDELSIIKPKFTIMVGSIALKSIMGDDYGVTTAHGKWFTQLAPPCYFYFSLYHPAWILHSQGEGEIKAKKKIMWDDIRAFRDGTEAFDNTLNWGLIKDEVNKQCRAGITSPVLLEEREGGNE